MPSLKSKVENTDGVLHNKKVEYARAIHQGLSCAQAAKRAKLSPAHTNRWNKDETVVKELRELQRKTRNRHNMSRTRVESIVLEAIQMARMLADPTAMIRGAQELNKMCGFYAPEKHQIELTDSQKRLVSKFDGLSDEELMAKLGDESDIIEGELAELPDPEDPLEVEALESVPSPEGEALWEEVEAGDLPAPMDKVDGRR